MCFADRDAGPAASRTSPMSGWLCERDGSGGGRLCCRTGAGAWPIAFAISPIALGECFTPGMRVLDRAKRASLYVCFGGGSFAATSTKGIGSGMALPVPYCWTKIRTSVFGSTCSRAVRVRSADCEERVSLGALQAVEAKRTYLVLVHGERGEAVCVIPHARLDELEPLFLLVLHELQKRIATRQ